MVARGEDGGIVFVDVELSQRGNERSARRRRDSRQKVTYGTDGAIWFAESEMKQNFAVCFNHISMLVLSAERAFCVAASTPLVEIA